VGKGRGEWEGEAVKALSIKQPWALAIMRFGKDIENRDWPSSRRGRIAIHASKSMTRDEYDEFYFFIRQQDGLWNAVSGLPSFGRLKTMFAFGAILGTVEIVDCVKEHSSPWFVGDYGFVLSNPQTLSTPIPCRGQLGFWDVPDEHEQALWALGNPATTSGDIRDDERTVDVSELSK
jgi:hypothetical protein